MQGSQRGQSLLETTVAISVLTLFLSAIFSGFYALWVKHRVSELVYEALICNETRGEAFCEQRFRRQVKVQIPFGKVRVQSRTRTSQESAWVVNYVQKPISFSVSQKIALPLR